ncbi:hypothetical protein Salat_0151500 [Sesamum alatum]|uniref:Zinc finger GRF-type domain-containing protein n=1 Tax=Sesamum alatum TaxID=300844 RepID=A0AAE1YY71_9LAMI|nr:hypothetical protein Salat_0151500 [Sesamum alatum]
MSRESSGWADDRWSDSTTSSRTYSRHSAASFEDAILLTCECGKNIVVRTSWTRLNPGRRFRACPGNGHSYRGSLQWVDPPMCRRAKEVIPGLLSRLSREEELVKTASDRVQEVESVVLRLQRFVEDHGPIPIISAFDRFSVKVKPCVLAYRYGPDPDWEALGILFSDEVNDNAHIEGADNNFSDLHPRHEVLDLEYSYETKESSDTLLDNVL